MRGAGHVALALCGTLLLHGPGRSLPFATAGAARPRGLASGRPTLTAGASGVTSTGRSLRSLLRFFNTQDFGKNAAYEPGEVPTRSYVALVKIGVRVDPDTRGEKLADRYAKSVRNGEMIASINAGQTFEVSGETPSVRSYERGQVYLKLARQPGWVFTKGVAGDWAGKDIVKRVGKRPGRIMNPFEALKREVQNNVDGPWSKWSEDDFYGKDAGGSRPVR